MRLINLAKIAAAAEGVRLKLLARRQAMRGVWGAVAAVFALFFAISLHLVIFEFLVAPLGARYAALVLLGLDLVLAAVFGMMAARSTPGAQEREAELISRQARAQLSDAATTFAVFSPVAKLTGASGLRATLLSAVATQFLSGRRRRR